MIDNEAWLELAEVSTDIATALHERCTVHHAIHLTLELATITTNIAPTTDNESSSSSDSYQPHQQQQPLTSVILETVECPSSRNRLIHLHPLLWNFLVYAADSTTRNTTHSTDECPLVQEDFLSHEEAKDNHSVSVKIVPLPIEPFLDHPSMLESATAKQHHPWRIRPVPIRSKVAAGNDPIKIDLSCIYLDPEILTQQQNRDGPGDNDFLEALLSSSLQGRLVMANTIIILNSRYGVAIVMISSIIEPGTMMYTRYDDTLPIQEVPQQSREDPTMAAIRLGGTTSYMVKVKNKTEFLEENCNVNSHSFPEDDHSWEPTIPGYESLLQDLMGMFLLSHHATGSAAEAAPSGILLTGCAGVGKSRLASCLAHTILSSSTNKSRGTPPRTIHWVSVQELLFLASTETDLVETVLLPPTDCDLWVIDDLHLLARVSQDGEDLDGAGRDVEYMLVLNSILQTIDQVVGTRSGRNDRFRCSIVGIGQVAMRLPPELIKIGRLEKEITLLPPTQSQRLSIWDSILPSDQVPSVEVQRKWSIALASATAGCVPSDLLRIYQDACTRAWARHTTTTSKITAESMTLDINSGTVLLEWADLAEAAHACIPSQLAELDVTKPSRPIEAGSMTWEQVHAVSWKMFGGYGTIRKRVFRHVVAPWRRFLRKLDQDSSDTTSSTAKLSSAPVGIEPPPGVLFHGPSGCGKSLAAICLAASLDLPVIQVRATDILDKWLGGSEALLRSLFARARAAAPCILFLDEIDAIAVNRAEDDTSDVSSRVLSTLLNELDGVSSGARQSRVLVVACTNRLEALDAALLRPGRLEEHVCLELPTADDLLEILERRVAAMPLDGTVQLPDLAQAFFDHNATGADVEGVCRDVCLAALRAAVDPEQVALSQHDFLQAISRL
jgi:SpoVK/Ycf46/Vps4 family AAA+-type ATPase